MSEPLIVLEVIPAGKAPKKQVTKGTCSKIMTGAELPLGADYIFMVEDSEILVGEKVRFNGREGKTNILFKAEDVKAGDMVLSKGRQVRPQDIAVMASVGKTLVKVGKAPRIGVISTGDELVEPGTIPSTSQIRNSNAYQLLAQTKRAGGVGKYYGVAVDNFDQTYELVTKAIIENDIVLLTGGVSAGDWDFVPEVLVKAGVNILFNKVRVQPGKPVTFGVHNQGIVFGLPGNPVSSFIQFELLVRPLMGKMMGSESSDRETLLKMGCDWKRKNVGRMAWIPVLIDEKSEIHPLDYHGSAHISALPNADGIISIAPGKNELKKGELVGVRPV